MKNNQWIWIIAIGAIAYFMFMSPTKDAKKEIALFCESNEPTTLAGYKTEILNWEGAILDEEHENMIGIIVDDNKGIAIASINDCMGVRSELDKSVMVKNDYGVEVGYTGAEDFFCSKDNKFAIVIHSFDNNEDDKLDMQNLYFSKMYDCTIEFLPSVSNTYGYIGVGVVALLILLLVFRRKR